MKFEWFLVALVLLVGSLCVAVASRSPYSARNIRHDMDALEKRVQALEAGR